MWLKFEKILVCVWTRSYGLSGWVDDAGSIAQKYRKHYEQNGVYVSNETYLSFVYSVLAARYGSAKVRSRGYEKTNSFVIYRTSKCDVLTGIALTGGLHIVSMGKRMMAANHKIIYGGKQ